MSCLGLYLRGHLCSLIYISDATREAKVAATAAKARKMEKYNSAYIVFKSADIPVK